MTLMETIYLIDLEFPADFVQLCCEYFVVTVFQAFEIIQQPLERPELLPDDVTLEMVRPLVTELTSYLSQESLDRLQDRDAGPAAGCLKDIPAMALIPKGFFASCDCFYPGILSLAEVLPMKGLSGAMANLLAKTRKLIH
jgi:hypothetical protein